MSLTECVSEKTRGRGLSLGKAHHTDIDNQGSWSKILMTKKKKKAIKPLEFPPETFYSERVGASGKQLCPYFTVSWP